jgi:Electron transfer DM13
MTALQTNSVPRVKRLLFVALRYGATLALGFALGVYALPILTAPPAPSAAEVRAAAGTPRYTAQFRRDLKGSDLLHWGEGKVSVAPRAISLEGEVAPGPAYKLYLATEFVETEADFARIKPGALQLGDVKTFKNFIVPVPESVDIDRYNTVIIWCESFSQFITAAKYR